MISLLLAASLTFTATATGVEKGTPVEFFFAGRQTDRDYESMFLLEEPIDAFCSRLEKAGLPRGKPTDTARVQLWPIGCKLSFEPSLDTFIDGKMPEGLPVTAPVYTGGTRLAGDACEAETNMPASVFSAFTLAQSPIVYGGVYSQGEVYGAFTAREKLKKGHRVSFTVSWDPSTMPRHLDLLATPGQTVNLIKRLRTESEKSDLEVRLSFDVSMTVSEATALAGAISQVDSTRIKFNGTTNLFYQSFLPLVKWRDRKERIVQPFELSLGAPDTLTFIEEDWNVGGVDPKLTPRKIPFSEAAHHPMTDTCFIFADPTNTVAQIVTAQRKMKGSAVRTWYVFVK